MKLSTLFAASLCALGVSAKPIHNAHAHQKGIVPGKHYDRIFIIYHENKDYEDVQADDYFPTIAENHNGVVLTNYFGVTHPSQPNYVALISGSIEGINRDNNSDVDRHSIVDLLEKKGISWKSYQQGYPGNCFKGEESGTYRRKHNPFMSFTNIHNDEKRCANIVNADQLYEDIKTNSVPQFVWFTPDMNNDGHDTDLAYSSNWTKSFIEPLMKEKNLTKNTLFVLTWDENDTWTKPNQVYTVLFGPAVKRSVKTDDTSYNHYSVLRSVEENWHLGNLGLNDLNHTAIRVKDNC
ncbi:hypothetical protein LRAMOSA08666 [Lichtheimia ramosa]|uniref:Acid phosphatase n=1 Tax=Lichtheimia ramosa TaxID=688394 RepID=A0A077WGF7_9FUNG|nr:hypothetical protein LRAMOSA08666 [Lichtheimia ramosa]